MGVDESGDGILWDADLNDFVELYHKEGISRRGIDPFVRLLRAVLTPAVPPPADAIAELEQALARGERMPRQLLEQQPASTAACFRPAPIGRP